MAMTQNQRDMIMRLYPFLNNKVIGEVVGVTAEAVRHFAFRNGMIKHKPKAEKPEKIKKPEIERGRHHRYIVCDTPYWELVKQYKAETPIRRFNHPFYEPTQKQFKGKKQDGTD
jgi:hypothetical protein